MLRMFVGKPGGGKSSGALRDIIEELVHGRRVVVTNLSIDPGKLNEFLQRRFPHADIDLHARLRILTEKEARRFWLYRSPTVEVPDVTREQEKAGQFPDFGAYAAEGVLYVIDEAHIMFDARAWMDSGQSLTYYNSQHRKLNDELVFITQFLELIDKRVRGFAQEFWYFRNNGMEKLFTLFVMPSYFTVKVYQRPPVGVHDLPSEVHRYRLDVEMANCYDTSAGVGIKGRAKPEQKQKKGLPVYLLAVPVCALVFGMWKGPDWLAGAVLRTDRGHKIVAPLSDKPGSGAQGAPVRPEAVAANAETYRERPTDSAQAPRSNTLSPHPQPKELPVVVTGYAAKGGLATVWLSDGRVLSESDLRRIETRFVETRDGARYYLAKPATSAHPKSAVPVVARVAAQESGPVVRDEGAWQVGLDGVSRLKQAESLGASSGRRELVR